MEPVKRIEGASDSQGQAAILAEAVQTRYWMKQAEAAEKTVQKAEHAEKATDEASKKEAKKLTVPAGPHQTYAEFEINQETREVIVRIVNAESGKLVRTIPADELASEMSKGNFQPNQLRRKAVLV